ncbi:MAG: hypothetical protein K0Q79_3257 [Flavipsychrobacter sp.]|jgi:hypothetical protein|nr:hypothetical protein [Flavipsychrobacter sp.]
MPFLGFGQEGDVCNAIITITQDAPNKFRNIKGKMLESNATATMWASGIKVPGSIGHRFVQSMGLFYECAFFQTKNKQELEPVYEQYKTVLNNCLLHEGYTLSLHPNFNAGIANYKKLVFMTEAKNDANPAGPPPHITLEVTYSKITGYYTIVMFIFEH